MKFLVTITAVILLSLNASAVYQTASQSLYQMNFQAPTVTSLLDAPLTLSSAWNTLGTNSVVDVRGKKVLAAYIDLDINDDNNARIRAVAFHTLGLNSYILPIKTVSASEVKLTDEYFEFDSDTDQKMLVTWDLDGIISYITFEGQVGTSSTGTNAQFESLYYTSGWK